MEETRASRRVTYGNAGHEATNTAEAVDTNGGLGHLHIVGTSRGAHGGLELGGGEGALESGDGAEHQEGAEDAHPDL